MARLRYSPAAIAELDEILAFSIERFGQKVDREYIRGLRAACARLRRFPQLAAVYPGIHPETRCLVHRSHRIFYRIDGEGILILRILNHARDVPRAF